MGGDLRLGELRVGGRRRHLHRRGGGNPGSDLLQVGAGRIQPQTGHAALGILPVAVEAVLGENRADVAAIVQWLVLRRQAERPRISVFRSNRGISAQLIDDQAGRTLAAVSWTESDVRDLKPLEQADALGKRLAERAKAAGIESAVFDRGGYQYHGRVKALAEGAREGGLNF